MDPKANETAAEHGLSEVTTNEKSSTHYAQSQSGQEFHAQNKKAEARLTRKLDLIIMPLSVLLYLSAYLDRGNLGNAKIMGLQAGPLHNSDTLYSVSLTAFFITYILLSIPSCLLAKQFNPSRTIAIGALIWSTAASCQSAVHNPAGLIVCRLFVGVGEAMFGQPMVLYYTFWYSKSQIAKRIGLFISAGTLAGAFGGLIAYGVASIKHPSIANWRVLFLIDGLPTFLVAVLTFLFLPSRPETTRYLTEEERTIALTRLNADNLGGHGQAYGNDWRAVRYAITDWRFLVIAVMYSCLNLTLGSVGGFLPTIVKGLGYSAARAQLFTVPPYAVALVFMLILTTYSDRARSRGIPAACVFCIGIVGWAILLGVNAVKPTHTQLHVRYFGCICIVSAGYSAIPLTTAWIANNSVHESQRATGLGLLNSLGQCLSIVASFIFPNTEGPRYHKGIAINIAFQCLGLFIALAMTTYYRLENRKRDKKEGGPPVKNFPIDTSNFDRSTGFRYVA